MSVLYTKRYTIYGVSFGIIFPIFAVSLDCYLSFGSLDLHQIVLIQKTSPLIWIIDTAPLFLGIVSRMVGKKRDELEIVLNSRAAEIEEKTRHLTNAVEDLEVKSRKIIELSITDALTGVFNRAYINENLFAEIVRSARYKLDLSIIMLDIDHFKKINDEFGHLVGDTVLTGLAQCLKDNLRSKIDWVGRFGGEEFLIILPQTSLGNAHVVAKKLKSSIAKLVFAGSISVTASFGLAGFNFRDKTDLTLENFISIADKNLYIAKNDGRDCIRGFLS